MNYQANNARRWSGSSTAMLEHYQIRQRTSQFFAAQLITQEWAQPTDAEHGLFRASSDIKDSDGNVLVTYALQRPDGRWAVMLINKDYDNPHQVRIVLHDESTNHDGAFFGTDQLNHIWQSAISMAR